MSGLEEMHEYSVDERLYGFLSLNHLKQLMKQRIILIDLFK